MKTPKKLTWLGHNCFLFEFGETKFVVDPFLPKNFAPKTPAEVDANYVLVSHGHADHCADAAAIAKRNDATLVAVAELAEYFARQGVARTEGTNVGGAIYVPLVGAPDAPKAQILSVQAPHSSTTPDGRPGGTPLGFVLSFSQNGSPLAPSDRTLKPLAETLCDADAFSIYFACDAGYFAELAWIGKLGIDVAVVPIGDRYTTGPAASLDSIRELGPRFVVPCHFGTWPPISQDAARWSAAVVEYASPATPVVMNVGQTIREDENGAWK